MLKIFFIFFPFAFDFRGLEEGGGVVQYLIYLTVVVSSVLLVFLKKPPFFNKYFSVFRILFLTGLFISIVNTWLRDVDFGNHVRVLSLYVLLYLGCCVGYLLRFYFGESELDIVFVLGFLASALFSFAYGLISTGLSLLEIRFQILSPVILPALGYITFRYLSGMRLIWLHGVIYFISLAVMLVSMTRSAMLGLFLMTCYLFWLVPRRKHAEGFSFLIKTFLVLLIAVFLSLFIPSEFYDRLFERVFGSYESYGFDVTTLSRLAELDFQIDALTDNLINLIFGLGLGAPYSFAEAYFRDLAMVMPMSELQDINWWAMGHNFWVYSLFAQGIVVGLFIPGVLLYFLFNGTILFKVLIAHRGFDDDVKFLGVGLALLAGILSTTIGGNPMGPRYSSLIFGVGLGIVMSMMGDKRKSSL